MSIREIITLPKPILRKKARKVRAFTPELQTLIDDMIETMREAPGVGLAAPQVNVSQRVIVIEFAEPTDEDQEPVPKLYVLINPEIVRHSNETTTDQEGCLSVPGYVGEVDRFSALTVKGRNRHGKAVRIKAKDWLARIIQHEIDHLDGVLYIDRANQVWRLEELEQQAEGEKSPDAAGTEAL
jgi:peptide deformylase